MGFTPTIEDLTNKIKKTLNEIESIPKDVFAIQEYLRIALMLKQLEEK